MLSPMEKKLSSLNEIFQKHHRQCSNLQCQCYKKLLKCQSLPVYQQKSFLNKVFVSIGELEVLLCILNYYNIKQTDILQKFILLHVDYLYSIKKNYFLAYYLTHYYLEKKSSIINMNYKQALYEIHYLILQKFKNKTEGRQRRYSKDD